MVKHRYYFLVLLILSLAFGPIQSIIYFASYDSFIPYLPILVCGGIVGVVTSVVSVQWIKRSQTGGVVNLGWRAEIGCVLYFATGQMLGQIIDSNQWAVCPVSALGSGVDACLIAVSVFMPAVLSVFLGSVYLWGLFYERCIGQQLRYRVACVEFLACPRQ